jgi:hypothetical protein
MNMVNTNSSFNNVQIYLKFLTISSVQYKSKYLTCVLKDQNKMHLKRLPNKFNNHFVSQKLLHKVILNKIHHWNLIILKLYKDHYLT